MFIRSSQLVAGSSAPSSRRSLTSSSSAQVRYDGRRKKKRSRAEKLHEFFEFVPGTSKSGNPGFGSKSPEEDC
ncbi:hypothetical protein BWQ96_06206 [Gracilariopsis chorda]|uniref:Uncharacterized protein n=1 Tax=Gracilariopsis chorda TaxID=448386 RepID=A0A2V3IPP9_9FLOR|nr:hypothetical protein BWQ96_06206 [Gracilariopsis chorda]|eukprot:PXF44033.1 hypothetical protein BWQ96_06206 [Gracilariopsis chorda]